MKREKNSSLPSDNAALPLYRIAHLILQLIRVLLFGIPGTQKIDLPDGPCLVLANHTSFFDPLILIALSSKPVGFVAGEHLFRNPFHAWVLTRLMGCIPYTKGRQDARATYAIIKRIHRGQSVCLFGEGNITYDGATEPLHPTIGKLVKRLHCTVVTVQIKGAYRMKPRWSSWFCRGRVQCRVAGVYTPDWLEKQTVDGLLGAVNRDLYTEEPAPQEGPDNEYHCSAKGIWHILYTCPVCGGLATIRSKQRRLICVRCGAVGRWTEHGKIKSDDFRFETLYGWNRWQQGYLRTVAEGNDAICIRSPDVRLLRLMPNHKCRKITQGTLSLTREHLTCGTLQFRLREIAQMDTRNKGVLLFSTQKGEYYELASAREYPGLLYKTMFEQLKLAKTRRSAE